MNRLLIEAAVIIPNYQKNEDYIAVYELFEN